MTRTVGWVVATLVAAALTAVPAPSAIAAQDPVRVKISKGHIELTTDGTVLVSLRTRCGPSLLIFEVDVNVGQQAASGASIDGPIPCDGRWQNTTVEVAPSEGSFGPGTATVNVFVGAFDPMTGDQEGVDTVTVKL